VQYIRQPTSEVNFSESEAIKWPKKRVWLKPHGVREKMHEDAKGNNKEPILAIAAVNKKSSKSDYDKEEKGVAQHPALAKEERSYGFIDDVGKKRA
jgi:hypothetical protein